MSDSEQRIVDANIGERTQVDARGHYPLVQAAVLFIGGLAYWPTLRGIVSTWSSNADYSHGFLVVPIAIALLWSRRDVLPSCGQSIAWDGLVLLGVAGLLRYLAGRLYLPELDGWSIPVWLGGLVLVFQGRQRFRWASPALVFLWFATPLPASVEIMLSTPLQQLAAGLGSWALRLFGQPALAEGTTILLNEHVLDIERACSGIRMFYGILAMAVAGVVLARLRGAVAVVLLLSTIPVAVVANVTRILVTGLLVEHYSGEAAIRFSHDFAGLLMIPLAVLLFSLVVLWLNGLIARVEDNREAGVSWLTKWVLLALVLIAAVIAWGRYQQRNVRETLLAHADQYEQQQNWPWVAATLERYLQMEPTDQQVFEQYAEAYEKHATTPQKKMRSVALLQKAWQQNTERTDLAVIAAAISSELGETRQTLKLCELLLETDLDSQQMRVARRLYADALLRYTRLIGASINYSWQDVREALESARKLPDADIQYDIELARLWIEGLLEADEATRASNAKQIMDELVLSHEKNPLAWLARHRLIVDFAEYYEDSQSREQATADLRQALRLVGKASGGDKTKIYLAAARQARSEGKLADAERMLDQAIVSTPNNPTPYVELAEVKRISDSEMAHEKAIEVLRSGLDTIGKQSISLLLPLASLQTDIGDWSEAEKTIETIQLQLNGLSSRTQSQLALSVGIIRGEILWELQGAYPAIRSLESVLSSESMRIQRQLTPQLFARGNVLLGRLYTEVGMMDQASEQYRSALQLDPRSNATRTEAITPVLNSGDLESAELLCRQLLRDDPSTQEALLVMIRIHVRRQLRLPPDSRNWEAAERAYEQATEYEVSPASLFLARVELLEAQGNSSEAEQLLREALLEAPQEEVLWRELAMVADRSGDIEAALTAADRYLQLKPAEIEPHVIKATLLEKANRSDEAEQLLVELLKQSSGNDWIAAAQELARLHLLLGKVESARLLLEEVRNREPTNLRAINTLASLAWATGDVSRLVGYEEQLRVVEGGSGTLWRFHRAQRLLDEATSKLDPKFEEVRRLSQTLQNLRPRWAKTSVLLGSIAMRRGKVDVATAAFRRAWELGDRSALLADRLIDLLTRQGRGREAQSYVRQVQSSLSLSSRLLDRAIPYFVQGDDWSVALRLAETWVARQPDDANAFMRLGNLLMAIAAEDKTQQSAYWQRASEAFEQALKLEPANIEAWVGHFLAAQRIQRAEFEPAEFLREVGDRSNLAPHTQAALIAQVYDRLGRPLQARQQYREAIRLAKKQADAVGAARVYGLAAAFYLDAVPIIAESHAREAIATHPHDELANYVLLQVLLQSDNSQRIDEAVKIIEFTGKNTAAADADYYRRLHAQLLAKRDSKQASAEAIELIESLLQQTADDQLLLALMYERSERLGPAFEILSRLVNTRKARTKDYVAFLEFWQKQFLTNSDGEDDPQFSSLAATVYAKLMQRPSRQAEWLRWKTRELKASDNTEKIGWNELRMQINELLEINQNPELWQTDAKLAWGRSLLRVLCEENLVEGIFNFVRQPIAGLKDHELGIALCHALILMPDTEFESQPIVNLLDDLQAEHPDRADLARAIGDWHLLDGRYELAVDAYRNALDVGPESKLTSNNLALALAELPNKLGDAQATIEYALEKYGEDPILLDTLVVLQLIEGQPSEALLTLNGVLAVSPENPAALMHKAMVYEALGEDKKMKAAYLDALVIGLDRRLLSQRDRRFCHSLDERLMRSSLDFSSQVDRSAVVAGTNSELLATDAFLLNH